MSFTCSDSCECENKPKNWNHCSKCDKMNCDLGDNSEEGWTYNDDTEKWCCADCSEEQEYDCVLNGCGEDVPCVEECKCECTHCLRNRDTDDDSCCECEEHGDDGCECDCHSADEEED